MQFNPLHAYLENHFAKLAFSNGETKKSLLGFRRRDGQSQQAMVGSLAQSVLDSYERDMGYQVTDAERSAVKGYTETFLRSFNKIQSRGNINDINSLIFRRDNYQPNKALSLSQLVNNIHASIYGSNTVENIERIQNISDEALPDTINEVLEQAELIEEGIQELIKHAEYSERLGKAFAMEPEKRLEEIENVATDLIKNEVEMIEEGIFKKFFSVVSNKVNNSLVKLSAPFEVRQRGARSAVAAELMGFLEPGFDIKSNFKSQAAFMLLMLDLYPYGGKKNNPEQLKKDFAALLAKPALNQDDNLFVDEVYQQLRKNIGKTLDTSIIKLIDPAFTSHGAIDTAAVNVSLFNNAHNLEALDKLIALNDSGSKPLDTTINSRLIAQFVAPLLRNHYEFDVGLLDALYARYKDKVGVSKLSIAQEITAIREASPFSDNNEMDFLKRLRPSGELEKFAYSSPDTNIPMIRALNNMHNLGTQVGFAVRIVSTSGSEELATKALNIKNAKGLIDVAKDAWEGGDIKAGSVIRNMVPNASLIKRAIHGFARTKTLYFSDSAERLQKGCGDLAKFDLTAPGVLNRTDAIKLLDVLLASSERHVIDIKINTLRTAINELNGSPQASVTQIKNIMDKVITPEVKSKLLEYGNINALASNSADSQSVAKSFVLGIKQLN